MWPMSALSLSVLAVASVVLIPDEDSHWGAESLPCVLGSVLPVVGSHRFFFVFASILAVLLRFLALFSVSRVSRSCPLVLGMTCLGCLRSKPAASLVVWGLLGQGRPSVGHRWVARGGPLTPFVTF